ncbi:SGNH/GDSL hydrolase family protein [Actinokineospora guangxiensis]|uniref:SGNH/GDSL hydrolase family protein n=2 Tax=Actinokineospora guangxiensis TaxID=1490288 RepID=A0ABW0EMU9_9PSEU
MKRVMALGDSITSADGWRTRLRESLRAGGAEFVGTQGSAPDRHEGRSGSLVTDVAASGLLAGWLAEAEPDIVLMHYGTNDLWRGTRSQAEIMAAYGEVLTTLRTHNPGVHLLMARLLPMDPDDQPGCPPRVVALNVAIDAWAAERTTPGSPITPVDQWTGFDVAADTSDGVHPNGAGDAKIAARWHAALAPLLA